MYDLNTIQRMNAEKLSVDDYVKVRDDAEVAGYVGMTGRIIYDDLADSLNFLVRFEGGTLADAYFSAHELEKQGATANEEQVRSAHEAALKVLDNHAIKPDWNRKGWQIRELLVEAILTERDLELPA